MSIFLFSLIVSLSQLFDDFVCVLAGIVQLICGSEYYQVVHLLL